MPRVEKWVQLFSDGLSNGKLPEAKSWLGVIRDAENDKQMGEIVDKFKVGDAQYFLAELPNASTFCYMGCSISGSKEVLSSLIPGFPRQGALEWYAQEKTNSPVRSALTRLG